MNVQERGLEYCGRTGRWGLMVAPFPVRVPVKGISDWIHSLYL